MLLKPLNRIPLPGSNTAQLVEPSAGTATALVQKLQEMSKLQNGSEDRILGNHFAGLRAIICIEDGGISFISQLVNSLHEINPEIWPIRVLETESIRATLEAVDAAYAIRLVDYFLDNITATQLEEINNLIRFEIWPDKDTPKNQ